MSKLVTPHQMELQAELFETFLESGNCWKLDDTNTATFGKLYNNKGASPVTLQGVKSVENFAISDTTVTISETACDTDSQVTVSGEGYTFNFQGAVNVSVATASTYILASASGSCVQSNNSNAKITVAGGYNTVNCTGAYNDICGLKGNDSVTFTQSSPRSTLHYAEDAGDITVSANSLYIDGGAGNNKISVLPKNNAVTSGLTLNGGSGNDSIDLTGDIVSSNRGKHLIEHNPAGTHYTSVNGYTNNDTVKLTADFDLAYVQENSAIAGSNVDNPDNTFFAIALSANNKIIVGGVPCGTVLNVIDKDGTFITPAITVPDAIQLSDEGETVTLTANHSGKKIYAAGGNDFITFDGATKVYLDGGSGNDTISLGSGSKGCTIYGGTGVDTIYNNDSLTGHLYQVKGADGNKYISGFTRLDTLQIVDDSTFTPTLLPGSATNFLPVRIGSSYIYLQSPQFAKASFIPIFDKSGNLISQNNPSGVRLNNPSGADVTLTSANRNYTVTGGNCSITGTTAADTIYNDCDNVTIIANGGADIITSTGMGNTYVFPLRQSDYNLKQVQGFDPVYDTLYINNAYQSSMTASASVGVGELDTISLQGAYYGNMYTFALTSQRKYYAETFSYNFNSATKTVNCTYYYNDQTDALTADYLRLNSNSTAEITNVRQNATITSTGANATLISSATNSKITGSGANAALISNADHCTVSGGGSANKFTVAGSNCSILTGAGNDSVTISAGATNNTIYSSGNTMLIQNSGSGNIFGMYGTSSVEAATINNFYENDTIASLGQGSITGFTAIDGGVRANFKYYGHISYMYLYGLRSGDTFKYKSSTTSAAVKTYTVP